jgi:hypothetical protein
MRWRYGDTNPVVTKPIASTTVIEIGDLVFQNSSGDVSAASTFAWTTDLPTTQDGFQDQFLGVAMQRSRAGDALPIRVATAGVFEFDCAAATFELGALVGPAKQASASALESQKVIGLTAGSEGKSIGRVAKRVNPADSRVLAEIVSTIVRGGPQAKA